MGTVYKAFDLERKEWVALKVLFIEHLQSARATLRFEQEAKVAASLDHPCIAKVHRFGLTSSGQPYLVMEFLDGTTLAARIAQFGQLPVPDTLSIFLLVCDGLSHAHKNKILHRDLKPGNIMLVAGSDETPAVKILDFGIAKILESSSIQPLHLTQSRELLGSPFYMSPEQSKGEKLDQRSDLYSLGCVLYEALTGGPPHVGSTTLSTMLKREVDQPLSLGEASLGRSFPEQLEAIVLKLLSYNPDDRYQSAEELKTRLLQFAQGSTSDLAADSRKISGKFATSVPRISPSKAIVGVLATGAAAVVIATFCIWNPLKGLRVPSRSLPATQAPSRSAQQSKAMELPSIMPDEGAGTWVDEKLGESEERRRRRRAEQAGASNDPLMHATQLELKADDLAHHGRFKQAEDIYLLVLPVYQSKLGPQSSSLGLLYTSLGSCCAAQRKPALAAKYHQCAVNIFTNMAPAHSGELIYGLVFLAMDYRGCALSADPFPCHKAESLLKQAIQINRHTQTYGKLFDADTLEKLGGTQFQMAELGNRSKFAEASQSFRESLSIFQQLPDCDMTRLGNLCTEIGSALEQLHDKEGYQQAYEQALNYYNQAETKLAPSKHWHSLELYALNYHKAKIYAALGKIDKAESCARHSLTLAQELFGAQSGECASTLEILANIANQRHEQAAAMSYITRANAINVKLYGNAQAQAKALNSLESRSVDTSVVGQTPSPKETR
jgi:serine/threonine protein kinase